jgi:outer membrane protein assembly factor BamB
MAMSILSLMLLVARGAESVSPTPATPQARILVLDNSDSDFKVPPFDDQVIGVSEEGQVTTRTGGFNMCQTIGGPRAIAASDTGRFFVVCENVGDRITAYETASGKQLWSFASADGLNAAAVAGDLIYALTCEGTIYGKNLVVLDSSGNLVKKAPVAGFDIAFDPNANRLWLVGADIKRCDMDLQVEWSIDPFQWCASSVDAAPDGSAWVTERMHPQAGGQNRLLKISDQGTVLANLALDISPMCVRVDRSDGSVWVTGIFLRQTKVPSLSLKRWPPVRMKAKYKFGGSRTYKFSAQGQFLFEHKHGGYSLDLDPSDNSVWVGGESRLLHYASDGATLGTHGNVSKDQKWIAVIPSGP